MNIDIRKSIHDNFKGSSKEEISSSITDALAEREELALPGLGVFFEILWQNCSKQEQDSILNKLKNGM